MYNNDPHFGSWLHTSQIITGNAASYLGVFRSNLMQQTGYSVRRCWVHSTSWHNTHWHAPLGWNPLGPHGRESDICMQELHMMHTDIGLWHGTCQSLMINMSTMLSFYTHHFIYFIILTLLNTLVLGIVLPRYMYWCLYSFVFQTPWGCCISTKTCRSYLKLMYSL